jgi:MSHA biogenesis protein MshQ
MPTYFARKSGNINATDVWSTTPSGTAAAVTFAEGDVLLSNSFNVTINTSTNLGATGQIRTDTTGGATLGGQFILNNGVTLTANINVQGAPTVGGLAISGANSATIVGSVTGIASGFTTGIRVSTSGTLNIVGDIYGTGINSSGTITGASGASPTINITGNVYGGGASNFPTLLIENTSGSLNITGNLIGGRASALSLTTPIPVTITGTVSGGTVGTTAALTNGSTNVVNITGTVIGGATAPGAVNSSTGTIRATRVVGNAYGPGNTTGLSSAVGISNSGLGIVEIEQLEYGTFGQSPTSGAGIRLKKASSNVAVFNYCDTAGAKTLIDATQNAAMPAASNVRSGVSYASGALTGSCAVPAAGSVSLGVPVDAGFGTAVLTAANVQSALTAQGLTTSRAGALDNLDTTVSSRLAPNGTLATVTTLTNAPTVPSAAAIADEVRVELATELARIDAPISGAGNAPSAATVATAVRTELATELARVDAAVSSRATAANIPTTDISAIKAKTDALNVDRVNNTATLSQVGNLLAQANS